MLLVRLTNTKSRPVRAEEAEQRGRRHGEAAAREVLGRDEVLRGADVVAQPQDGPGGYVRRQRRTTNRERLTTS